MSLALSAPLPTPPSLTIHRGYIKIRGLIIKLFLRNPPQSLSTALGHLDLVRKNLRSTKIPPFQPSLALASLRSSTPSLWDSLDPTSLECPPFIRTVSATIQRHLTSPVSCLLNLVAGISTYLLLSSVDTSTTPLKNQNPPPTMSPLSRLS